MEFLLHIITITATSVPTILGFNLILGKGKILHFGPLGVSIVTGYATFLTVIASGNYVLGLFAGLCAAVLLSLFFAWLSLRLEPDGFGVMSIAVHLGMITLVLNWTELTRGALGVPRIPRMPFLQSSMDFAVVSVCVAMLCAAVLWWITRGAFGRALSALAQNEWHAQALGIDRRAAHIVAFLIGGIGSLLSNVLYHQYIYLLHPSDFGFPYLIFMVMAVVAGVPGSVPGCLASVILLTVLREGLRFVPLPADVLGPMRLIMFGIILFAAVWYRRDTLFPKARTV